MKKRKRALAFLLALILTLSTIVTALAVTVTVKYKYFVYSDEITYYRYDYSVGTTPEITHRKILADSSLGSGSALYHVKWLEPNQTICYCIQPGFRSDDSSNYVQSNSAAAWYNLPAEKQAAIAMVLALGYPSQDYGKVSYDTNSSETVMAEKYGATQAIIWGIICEYIDPYDFYAWSNPFYNCVDTSRYPTFEYWYDALLEDLQQSVLIPSFAATTKKWCDPIELQYDSATGKYKASVKDENGVLANFDYTYNKNGITISRSKNTLNITATEAAAKTLMTTPLYLSAQGGLIASDPDDAVLCYYDSTGKYQTMGRYTYDGIDPQIAYIMLTAKQSLASLEITKLNGETQAPLKGVGYHLYDANKKQVGEGYTDKYGKLVFSDLPLGKYTYQEFSALDGFELDDTVYEADLTDGGTLQVYHENFLKRGSLTVHKVDAAGNSLTGVSVLLEKSTNGGVTWNAVETKNTGTDGIASWDKLDTSASTLYRITETATLPGYFLMTSPIYEGSLPEGDNYDVTITACNSQLTMLPFTGGNGFTTYFLFAMLMLGMSIFYAKKSNLLKEKTK